MYGLPGPRSDILSEDSTFEVIATPSDHSVDGAIVVESETVAECPEPSAEPATVVE
jgi:hypothetical protein